eukprot:5711909-Amphidinium_carterae.2
MSPDLTSPVAKLKWLDLRQDNAVDEILVLGGEEKSTLVPALTGNMPHGSGTRVSSSYEHWPFVQVSLLQQQRPHTASTRLIRDPATCQQCVTLCVPRPRTALMLVAHHQRSYARTRAVCEHLLARNCAQDPDVRLAQLHLAGELRVPFTTGLLVGIGETDEEIEVAICQELMIAFWGENASPVLVRQLWTR